MSSVGDIFSAVLPRDVVELIGWRWKEKCGKTRFPHSQSSPTLQGCSPDFRQSAAPERPTPHPVGRRPPAISSFLKSVPWKVLPPQFLAYLIAWNGFSQDVISNRASQSNEEGDDWWSILVSYAPKMRRRLIYRSFPYFKLKPKQMGQLKIKPHASLKHAEMTPHRFHWSCLETAITKG